MASRSGVSPRQLLTPEAKLWHVADLDAIPLIRQHGLLSAERLCALFEVTKPRQSWLLSQNRDRYEVLAHPVHGRAALRWQRLKDDPLAKRLAPGVTPEAYRRFINSHVYFWPLQERAEGLDRYERARPQRILCYRVPDLLQAGLTLLGAPINGGGTFDRYGEAIPERRRRSPALYQPLAEMTEPVVEVAVPEGIPPAIPFEVLPLTKP